LGIEFRFWILAFPWYAIFTPEKQLDELYNLMKNPEEYDNLVLKGSLPPEVISPKQKLEAETRKILKSKEAVKLNKKDEDMLRSLGYVK